MARFGRGQGELYQRATVKAGRGLDLSTPPDQLQDAYHPYLSNVRAYTKGGLSPRPGLAHLFDLAGTHSITQLQDSYNSRNPLVFGVGTELYAGSLQADLAAAVANGFSGNPLSFVVARPERSPDPWLYIADSNRMTAMNSAREVRNWGIAPPKLAPTLLNPDPAKVLAISDFTALVQDGQTWNAAVGAGALSIVNRTSTTISRILYDSGTTGYCVIQPAALGKDIQPNQRILVGGVEYTLVEQILPAISDTTIEAIEYDSGIIGLCTIQLTTATAGLQPNSMLLLNGGAEAVRVLEVTDGIDNRPCIRVNTTTTITTGMAISGVDAFRCYLAAAIGFGATLVCKAIQSTVDPTVGTPVGDSTIRLNALRDLTQTGTKRLTDDDEISIGIYIQDINRLVEGRIWFDVDPNTIPGIYDADDLSRNYFFYPFRVSDLQTYADFSQSISQVGATPGRIQRSTYDAFNAGGPNITIRDNATGKLINYDQAFSKALTAEADLPGLFQKNRQEVLRKYQERFGIKGTGVEGNALFQIGSGKEQWYQLTIKVRDLKRVGEDRSRTLKDVTSIMVNFKFTQVTPSVTVDVAVSSWWIGGGYNLDAYSSPSIPSHAYYYRYTGWNDNTGDESLPSPATRVGVLSRRQQNSIQCDYHPDTQVTKLNVYRWGGSLPQWLYVGQVDNPSAGTVTFTDNLADESIAANQQLRLNLYAPFPIADRPLRGTCRVVGNRVIFLSNTTAGDTRQFDLTYAPGSEIVINGKTHLLYAQPTDTNHLELAASAGAAGTAAFYMPSPIRLGMPISRVFGPYGSGSEALVTFACGDPLNPGYLYWTNENDPNATTDANYIEVAPPNEPLINGCIYDGRGFVFSSERCWQITAARDFNGGLTYAAQEIANSRGLVSPWGLCVDRLIYFLSKDGVYYMEGGQPVPLTKDTLYELFPHDGIPGVDINDIAAPDLSQDTYLRLSSLSGMLYLDYLVQARPSPEIILTRTLVLDINNPKAWVYDAYGDGGVRVRYPAIGAGSNDYRMVCATENKIASLTGATSLDYDEPFTCAWKTMAYNANEFRAEKHWADYESRFLANSPGDTVTCDVYAGVFGELIQSDVINLLAGTQRYRADLPRDLFKIDLGARYSFASPAGNGFTWYSWEPSLLLRPEQSTLRTTDWDDCGTPGTKFIQGVILEADTLGEDRTVEIRGDDGVLIDTITINHNGQSAKTYSFTTPGKSRLVRVLPTDADSWRLYNISWVFVPYPESATVWQTTPGDLGSCGWKHIPEAYLDVESTTATSFIVTIDGADYTYVIPSTNGVMLRKYLRLQPVKGKIFQFRLTNSAGVRVFNSSCVHVARWERGPEDRYDVHHPFGGPGGSDGGAVL
jgi:hypothetical protein